MRIKLRVLSIVPNFLEIPVRTQGSSEIFSAKSGPPPEVVLFGPGRSGPTENNSSFVKVPVPRPTNIEK